MAAKKYQQKKKSNVGLLVGIAIAIIVIFVALFFITKSQNEQKIENATTATGSKLYGDYDLQHQSSIDLLDDKNYQNIISPADLEKKISSGEGTFVYFFSPECSHCQKVTPELMPLADELNVKVEQYNILEFTQGWEQYTIEYTPTLVYYKDGEEIGRIIGEQPEENFRTFFEEVVKQ